MTHPISTITPFSFEEHEVRAVIINGEPWFVAVDICNALKLTNSTEAIRRLDEDEKDTLSLTEGIQDGAGNPNVNIISESGMSTLVLRCRDAVKQGTLPHRFRKWVTSEVLPSIRKTGKYEHPQYKLQAAELFNDDDTRCLTHLVWSMANGFHFARAWTHAIWYALRRVTGVPSPQHFEIRQLPLLAEECRRIYGITNQLKSAIFDAEKQTIRRVLRHREDKAIYWAKCNRCLKRARSSITASWPMHSKNGNRRTLTSSYNATNH
ncbi:MAG: BRO-N domain-containing protein [Symbiopectobacterium sp.]|uniref:BRO-N domain-containing protein n=1 Tax=Symbiopectobacterium sp. TaxID=2952789 RepID=UPI003F3E177D